MQPSFREIANGKWHGILVSLGFHPDMLNGKHQKCPICNEGVDRFRWDDKGGSGSYYCSQCGPGYGIDLVMKIKGLDFKEAAKEVERAAGFVKSDAHKPAASDDDKIRALRRMWKESRPITQGDEVWKYLEGRGLPVPPKSASLRFHPNLSYRDGDESGIYPAMLALITAPDGSGASLHRTYLKDGKKAPVSKAKKIMPGLPLKGGAIRLSGAEPHIGVAEGIETALACSALFGVPTWSCISAGGIESFQPPAEVASVTIYADRDISFTGEAAAYALAKRLHLNGLVVDVKVPDQGDWADEILRRGGK